MRRRVGLIVIILCLMCLLQACSGLYHVDEDDAVDKLSVDSFYNEDGAKYFNRTYNNNEAGTLINESDLFSGLRINSVLSEDSVTICNVPGCTHQDQDTCLANELSFDNAYNAIYENHVMLLINGNEPGIYMINTDGSNLHSLISWEGKTVEGCWSPVLVKNQLYVQILVSDNETDEEGYVCVKEAELFVYRIDMETGDITQLYASGKHRDVQKGGQLMYDAGILYCGYHTYEKNYKDIGLSGSEYIELLSDTDEFITYLAAVGEEIQCVLIDTKTSEVEEITKLQESEYSCLAFWCGKLVLQSYDELYLYDVKDGTMENWEQIETVVGASNWFYSFHDFLLIQKLNNMGQDSYYLCAPDSLELHRVILPYEEVEISFTMIDESDTMLYFALKPIETAETTQMSDGVTYDSSDSQLQYELVPKTDFYSWIEESK